MHDIVGRARASARAEHRPAACIWLLSNVTEPQATEYHTKYMYNTGTVCQA